MAFWEITLVSQTIPSKGMWIYSDLGKGHSILTSDLKVVFCGERIKVPGV